jgi:flagellar assembly protein FliH
LSKIVNGGKTKAHIVKPYKFHELHVEDTKNDEFVSFSKKEEINVVKEEKSKNEAQSSEIIENLLKKIEELSKLVEQQPKVENNSECEQKLAECFNQLSTEKQKAFEEGFQKASEECSKKYESEVKALKSLFEDSIKKLSEINKIFEEKLESIEKDLISVALDIAEQVIQKEVSDNSKEIAKALATSLMQELKNAKKVTIKVNPKDAEALKDIEGIEIIPDEAVKEGGIVIISDVGNIDAQLDERFKNVKEAILNARNSK